VQSLFGDDSYRYEGCDFSAETEVDYLVTNAVTDKATAQWIVISLPVTPE
jgi:hypothetical protein